MNADQEEQQQVKRIDKAVKRKQWSYVIGQRRDWRLFKMYRAGVDFDYRQSTQCMNTERHV